MILGLLAAILILDLVFLVAIRALSTPADSHFGSPDWLAFHCGLLGRVQLLQPQLQLLAATFLTAILAMGLVAATFLVPEKLAQAILALGLLTAILALGLLASIWVWLAVLVLLAEILILVLLAAILVLMLLAAFLILFQILAPILVLVLLAAILALWAILLTPADSHFGSPDLLAFRCGLLGQMDCQLVLLAAILVL